MWLPLPPLPSHVLIVGGSLVGVFPLPGGILVFTASTYFFYVIGWKGKVEWFKTAGVYSTIFKVPARREEIGDPLDMYSVNRDNSPI